MRLVKLMTLAFPHLDRDVIADAADELLAGRGPGLDAAGEKALREEIAELTSAIDDHRKEIARLNTVIVNQRAGMENASPQVLGIVAERGRQKRVEGYSDIHDDEHENFELSKAAAAYMSDAILRAGGHEGHVEPPAIFPWKRSDWKRKPVMRQMEIGVTLFIADMERMDRNGIIID